jgi:hypothetical protein
MDVARQVLRFSIPGSLFLISSLGLIIMGRVIAGDDLGDTIDAIGDNLSPAVAVVAAVPIGFIVYQVYYVTYRPVLWPFSLLAHPWVRLDRGSQILSVFSHEQVQAIGRAFEEPHIDTTKPYDRAQSGIAHLLRILRLNDEYIDRQGGKKQAVKAYKARWGLNWNVLRAVVDLSEAKAETAVVKREYVALSDLYHALGASRTALWMGWWTSVIAALIDLGYEDGSLFNDTIGVVAGALLALGLVLVLHATRRQTWDSAEASLKYGLLVVFTSNTIFDPEPGPDGGAGAVGRRRAIDVPAGLDRGLSAGISRARTWRDYLIGLTGRDGPLMTEPPSESEQAGENRPDRAAPDAPSG